MLTSFLPYAKPLTPNFKLGKAPTAACVGRQRRAASGHAGDIRLKRWPMAVKETAPPAPEHRKRRERPPSSALCPRHLLSRCLPLTAVPAHPSLLYEAQRLGERKRWAFPARGASPVFPGEYPSPRFSYRLPSIPKQRGNHPFHTAWTLNRY